MDSKNSRLPCLLVGLTALVGRTFLDNLHDRMTYTDVGVFKKNGVSLCRCVDEETELRGDIYFQ